MRKGIIIAELFQQFKVNPRIIILNCDDSLFGFGAFIKHDPLRIYNVGIAEQATVGIAAAMSATGLIPVVFSKMNFLVLRAYEQLKYDVNEHRFPVKMIGIGINNYSRQLGRTHCMDEDDLPLFALLKNICVMTPTEQSCVEDIDIFVNSPFPTILRCE
jgi:transketolase